MSHQTGIRGMRSPILKIKFIKPRIWFSANDVLKKFFSKCKDGKVRVFKVVIEEGKSKILLFMDIICLILLNFRTTGTKGTSQWKA